MDTLFGNTEYWLTFGFKVARLEFFWGSKSEVAQEEFQPSLDEVLQMLKEAASDCQPNLKDYQSFTQSILLYFQAHDQIAYSCILIGVCQFRAKLSKAAKSGELIELARSSLMSIPTSVVNDKDGLFAVILENADEPVWTGQERILEFLESDANRPPNAHQNERHSKDKVFIVHGRNWDARDDVEQLAWRIGLHPIIIMNQPNRGQTIIEKIEHNSDVSFAIVLYTDCDEGKAKDDETYRPRARQNVVFEHGYMAAKLGRDHVVALVEKGVETPGDLDGIVYISLSASDWKNQLMRELDAAGLAFDWSRA